MRLYRVPSSLALLAVALGLAASPLAASAGDAPTEVGASTAPVGVVLVPFEDQSGAVAPPQLGEWLARGLQQRLTAADPTLLPRLVSLPAGTGATVRALAEIGRSHGAAWVVRGGMLSLSSPRDPSGKTVVSLFADVVRVENAALHAVRAEGRHPQLGGERPWAALESSPDAFRRSPVGQALEQALDALATSVRGPLGMAGAAPGVAADDRNAVADDGDGLDVDDAAVEALEGGPTEGSDQTLAADEELQQLLSGAEAALEVDGGAHPDEVRSVQESLAALQAALQQDAERLEGGADPASGTATRDARRADLEQAVRGLVEASASGEVEIDGGDGNDADRSARLDVIGQAKGFVQRTLDLVLEIQELRAAFQSFDEERSSSAVGGDGAAAEGDGDASGDAAEFEGSPSEDSPSEARAQDRAGAAASQAVDTEGRDAELGELDGVVMEDGRPVAGAEVVDEASGSRSVTDANGHFALGNLPAGTLASLKLLRAGRTIAAGRVDVPRSRAGVADFEIGAQRGSGAGGGAAVSSLRVLPSNVVVSSRTETSLGRASTVRGEVRDPDGKPIPRALVRIGGLAAARTDSRGAYRFLRVPAGEHRLVVDAPGMITHAQTILAAAHGDRTVPIRLRVAPASRRLELKRSSIIVATAARLGGRVRDGQGRPIAGARIAVVPASGVGRALGERTDRAGRFRFAAVSPGAYRVLAVKPGYRTGREDVTLGARAKRSCDITLRGSETHLTRAVAARAKRVSRVGARLVPGVGRRVGHHERNARGVAPRATPDVARRVAPGVAPRATPDVARRVAPGVTPRVTRGTSTLARAMAGGSTERNRDRERYERATGRDLGSGRRCVATGVAQDSRARAVEGTITVSRNGSLIGQLRTTGGRFSLFDLEPGRYVLRLAALRGGVATGSVIVGRGSAPSVRLVLR